MKGSWGLYGHRPRPDSKESVTNRMGGAPGPCQSQRGDVSPGGGWKQAGHVEKSGKEAGVLSSAMSRSLEGAARTGSCPHGAPWHCQARAASRHVQQSHASIRDCTRLAGHPLRALELPLPPPVTGEEDGDVLGVSCHFCNGDVAGQGVPHLPPGSQLDEGTDGLVGAGPAGKHVAPVEGLEEADEVGTLCLLKGRCLLAV